MAESGSSPALSTLRAGSDQAMGDTKSASVGGSIISQAVRRQNKASEVVRQPLRVPTAGPARTRYGARVPDPSRLLAARLAQDQKVGLTGVAAGGSNAASKPGVSTSGASAAQDPSSECLERLKGHRAPRGRRKVEFIEDTAKRGSTFSTLRQTIMRKLGELEVKCDAKILIAFHSHKNHTKTYAYGLENWSSNKSNFDKVCSEVFYDRPCAPEGQDPLAEKSRDELRSIYRSLMQRFCKGKNPGYGKPGKCPPWMPQHLWLMVDKMKPDQLRDAIRKVEGVIRDEHNAKVPRQNPPPMPPQVAMRGGGFSGIPLRGVVGQQMRGSAMGQQTAGLPHNPGIAPVGMHGMHPHMGVLKDQYINNPFPVPIMQSKPGVPPGAFPGMRTALPIPGIIQMAPPPPALVHPTQPPQAAPNGSDGSRRPGDGQIGQADGLNDMGAAGQESGGGFGSMMGGGKPSGVSNLAQSGNLDMLKSSVAPMGMSGMGSGGPASFDSRDFKQQWSDDPGKQPDVLQHYPPQPVPGGFAPTAYGGSAPMHGTLMMQLQQGQNQPGRAQPPPLNPIQGLQPRMVRSMQRNTEPVEGKHAHARAELAHTRRARPKRAFSVFLFFTTQTRTFGQLICRVLGSAGEGLSTCPLFGAAALESALTRLDCAPRCHKQKLVLEISRWESIPSRPTLARPHRCIKCSRVPVSEGHTQQTMRECRQANGRGCETSMQNARILNI